jgi:PKD repeat protein/glucose/arabinose dehydrogenase
MLGVAVLVATFATFVFGAGEAPAFVTLPSGWDDQPVTTVPRPTAMDWTPDGRIVIVTHPGFIRIVKNGALKPTPALDWRNNTCRSDEWGMNGVAVDPDFATNRYVYVYYTAKKFGSCAMNAPDSPVNRVSRFVLNGNDMIDPLSETPIVDGIPGPAGIHAAGDIEIGPDGNLFIAAGDGGCDFRGDSGCFPFNDAAQDLGNLSGKVLRVTRTGGIPPDNPFTGPGTTQCSPTGYTNTSTICQEIYSSGFRNPFRIAIDPNSSTPVVRANDVGLNTWEEVNELFPGGNFGWNVREGYCVRDSTTDCGPPPPGMTNPIHTYNHDTGCVSVTAGDFVPNGLWPSGYDGDYLFGDLVCQKLWRMEPDGSGGQTVTEFATNIPWLIDGRFAPDGASQSFYYISWVGFPDDEIRKIKYTGSPNRTPDANITASPTSGGMPLTVNFNGTTSVDPNPGDVLTYDWDFGDGSPHSSSATPAHTYMSPGTFTAKLTVDDGHGAQDSATIKITVGNEPPQVSIDAPVATKKFAVGEVLTLVGSAEDPESGTLPNSSLTWRVEKHHDTHFHPFLPETAGNNIPITGPEPEDLTGATNSYLEIVLSATDPNGLTSTVSRNIYPDTVPMTFSSNPSGMKVLVAGSQITLPQTVTSWKNWNVIVNAQSQFDNLNNYWHFSSWSDGGAANHTIHTPTTASSYTANFSANQAPTASASRTPAGGHVPLAVSFSGTASSDPDDPTLTYDWDFGDGSPHSSSATPNHTYTSEGNFTATLTVSDGHGGTDVDTVPVNVTNDAPQPTIDAPLSGELWSVGESMTLTGSATDTEDGTLGNSALEWEVIKHHDGHTHTELAPTTGNDLPLTGPAPEDLAATTNTYLEIRLKATDSLGKTTTVTRTIGPKTVDLTFATNPTGLSLTVAGSTVTAPQTITSWDNWDVPVSAASQSAGSQYWHYSSWSDGGAASHTITTPSAPATYTATFSPNQPPTAVISASPLTGEAPLQVNFTGSGSFDPDDPALTYDWDFGDGTPHSSSANPTHTYTSDGDFTATLTVSDGHGGTDAETKTIDVMNDPPQPSIDAPVATKLWSVGEQITLTGSAEDPEEGAIPNSGLEWEVIKHHGTHTHTLLSPTSGNDIPITGPAPEDLAATTNTTLEIKLTATDSLGKSATVTRTISPKTVDLTFATDPAGLSLTVAGTSVSGPQTITSWANWGLPVSAASQSAAGQYWHFSGWSDSGAASHTITTPASPATYTATFSPNQPPTAIMSATPTSGDPPLQVAFDGSGSFDPDDPTLIYDWDFGDGSPHSSSASPNHTFNAQGLYTVTLTVSDGHGLDDTETEQVQVNSAPPQPTITAPVAGKLWRVGEQITLTGSATDLEDGSLPDSALEWEVVKHHGSHTHTELAPTSGNNLTITGPAPEDLAATTNTYLEIRLKATDSANRTTTVTRNINPRTVTVNLQSGPSGNAFQVQAAGSTFSTPQAITSWDGWTFPLSTSQNQFDSMQRLFVFGNWSDGGAISHNFTTPAANTTVQANFTQYAHPRPGGGSPLRVPLVPEFDQCVSPDSQHAAPLDEASCTGPTLSSSELTTSNQGRMTGNARLDAMAGTPPVAQDDADLLFKASVTDVLRSGSGGGDYSGNVIFRTKMRMTDNDSGAFQETIATVSDFDFSIPVSCVATPTATGGTCNLNTSSDVLLPNFARERSRAVISTYSMEILDLGPDGSLTPPSGACPPTCGTGDESVFVRQGVVAP